MQQQEEAKALETGGEMAQLQVKMQNSALNSQMLSNISKMNFDTIKAIAANFKA